MKKKLKKNSIFKSSEKFEQLYKEGDLFRVIKINNDDSLMPIEAMRLKDGVIFGFDYNEIELLKKKNVKRKWKKNLN